MINPTPNQTRSAVAILVVSLTAYLGVSSQENYVPVATIPVPGDVPTNGFGHTQGVKLGDKVTVPRAMRNLADELDNVYLAGIKKCITAPLYQYEMDAYLSLAYNIGVGGFCKKADKTKNPPEPDRLLDLINTEQYSAACERIEAFKYGPGKKVLPGLVKRRAEERKTCEGRA